MGEQAPTIPTMARDGTVHVCMNMCISKYYNVKLQEKWKKISQYYSEEIILYEFYKTLESESNFFQLNRKCK